MTREKANQFVSLGLSASQAGDAATAIDYLKEAISIAPDDADARFLLGAEYASIGLIDSAIDATRQAANMAPHFEMAHFQLGLLLLTSGRIGEADEAWKGLDGLPGSHPLALFRRGLLHMVRDEFPAALSSIRAGIQACTDNPSLANEMARFEAEIAKAIPLESAAHPNPRQALH